MSSEERARRERAARRAQVMVLHKTQLGGRDVDFTPIRGAAAISLATRLTVESFSLVRSESSQHSGEEPVNGPVALATRQLPQH